MLLLSAPIVSSARAVDSLKIMVQFFLFLSRLPRKYKATTTTMTTSLQIPTGEGRQGRVINSADIEIEYGKRVLNVGMPRVIAPLNDNEQWLMWYHLRDEALAPDVLSLSTGRIVHATSPDGLMWKLHPDSPILNPAKESGDW